MYAADMDIDMDPSGSAKALGLTAIVKHRRIRGLSSPINDRDLGASPPAPFCPSTTITPALLLRRRSLLSRELMTKTIEISATNKDPSIRRKGEIKALSPPLLGTSADRAAARREETFHEPRARSPWLHSGAGGALRRRSFVRR